MTGEGTAGKENDRRTEPRTGVTDPYPRESPQAQVGLSLVSPLTVPFLVPFGLRRSLSLRSIRVADPEDRGYEVRR